MTDRGKLTRRDAVRLGVLVPTAGFLAAGCGREPVIDSEDAAAGSFRPQDLQPLLDRRAEAQLQGDEQAYLADLDPANSDLLDRERMVFANLRQFELDSLQFVVRPFTSTETDPDQPDSYRVTPVVKVVKLSADAAPEGVLGPGEAFQYAVSKRDGQWVVTDIVPLAGPESQYAQYTADAPWNLNPLTVLNVGNVWLAADDTVPDLDRYAEAAEAQVADVEAMWGDRARFPGHVIFLSRSTETLRAWYSLGDLPEKYEGVQVPVQGVDKEGEAFQGQFAAARMALFLHNIEEHSDDPSLVMRHELTHAVTSRARGTGDYLTEAPRWAIEGFARFIEVQTDPDRARGQRAQAADAVGAGHFTGSLPRSDEFYNGDAISYNYALACSFFMYIAQIRDLETAIDFYAETIQWGEPFGQVWADTPAFDGVCQEIIGMGAPELLDQWASFVQGGA